MSSGTDWQTFFDHHASEYMDNPFVRATLAEVDFLIEHLHLKPGMRMLDLGCGTGRHAVELARRGLIMTGVDLSAGMLAQARAAADAAGVTVEWVHSPAQDYRPAAPFDAAYSVCEGALSLFGPADPFDRDVGVLTMVAQALKPGGRALFTVLSSLRYVRMYGPDDVAAGRFDPLTMTEHGSMDVNTPDGPRTIPTLERGYVPTELRLMLTIAGFTVEHIGGGTAGDWGIRPPQLDEYELMAIVHR